MMRTTTGTTAPAPGAHASDDRPTAVVAGALSDSHTWGLVFLQLLLEEHGHRVVNLGPCVPEDLIISTLRAERPALLVMSSVNGHGYRDGMRAITALRECPDLARVTAVIGGKLGIHGEQSADETVGLMRAGYDAVFDDSAEGVATFTRMLAPVAQRAAV
ncbi:cobalamin-dependent protein [Streptomyces sp. NBC_01498]|uniref:cobalamin B12-binding domain-containing protein n=1 Tax=Streptomyces sp. NBC_01498 TaxID=2975870 RepID=UPI002E7BC170|nr:cobalamin-dependent protein [Streptomyces sp. NBC_01498]WTL28616.1 cobalamin-dependent protein [Streptomyces sp. NBC_01498]